MRYRWLGGVLALLFLFVGCSSDSEDSPAQKMSEGHEGDTPAATEAAREPAVPVEAREVMYGKTPDGDSLTGYLAVPSRVDSVLSAHGWDPASRHLPGLVVIHEWWGLNDNIRTATRRLAGEGYRTLAVDLYSDSTAQTPQQAQALIKRATNNGKRLLANLRAAHEYLQSEGRAPRVGVMGWCFGGGMTFRAVADRPSAFDAAVVYYGTPEAITDGVLQRLKTPVLAHFGRQDEVVSTDQVKAFQARLKGHEGTVQIYQYDAGHAFANPSGENYNSEAATQAWTRTTSFLASHLYSESAQ